MLATEKQLTSLVSDKLGEIDDKLRDLHRMKRALAGVVDACRCGGDLSRCDVLEGLGEPATVRGGSR